MRSLIMVCALASAASADAKLPSDAAFNGKPGDWTHFDVERSTGEVMYQSKGVAILVPLAGVQWFTGDASFEQPWEMPNLHAMLRDLAKAKGTKRDTTSCVVGTCTRLTHTGELTSFDVKSKLVVVALLSDRVHGSGIASLEVRIDDKPVWKIKATGYGNGSKAAWGAVPWKTSVPAATATRAYVTPPDLGQAFVDLRPENGPLVLVASTANLDKAIVRRYLKRNLMKLTYCYEKELLAKPTIAGSVDFRFEIGVDGKVSSSSAKGVDPDVEACAAAVVKAIEFPMPKNKQPAQASFTMRYQIPAPPAGKKI